MPTSPVSASTLVPIADRLWQARHAFIVNGLPVHTRMTVARLANGDLWVHSPIPPDATLVAELQALGPVTTVVAPNRAHHLFAKDFVARFPSARLYLAPGLARKRPDLDGQPLPPEPGHWMPELEYHLFGGMPLVNETVWFHRPSHTLILTDLCQWWTGDDLPWKPRLWASLTGVRRQLGVARHLRLMVRDRAAAAASARRLLAWPIRRVCVAHVTRRRNQASGFSAYSGRLGRAGFRRNPARPFSA